MSSYLFTSESVSEGHPDKVADRISDAVLDAYLDGDPHAHVACETLVTTGQVVVAGEVKTSAEQAPDVSEVARAAIKDIGYDDGEMGFDYKSCGVLVGLHRQSADIDRGVSRDDEIGAGDQGMMFGYAVRETAELMPAPIMFAHRIVERMAKDRKKGKVDFLRPDAKSQVTIRYENDKPAAVTAIVVSTQHTPSMKKKQLREYIVDEVIPAVIPAKLRTEKIKYHLNPTGRFVIGGPHGDAGLTGRKIIVDTYGGAVPHGGGAFSGKDATKVDRSAHYMARYVAKNIVAARVADRLMVQLAYAIGVVEPVSVMVNSFGTGKLPDEKIAELVQDVFPLTPKGIIQHLDLRRPVFQQTAAYGHFGRKGEAFTWEKTDLVDQVKRAAEKL
ncbi:MAG: methionine adenosyltransferase [Candidatus Dadabacteria bacterium]|nr:MAG: methionine adenosyltransferase [Candidatus Dadabacteria bacterium]